MRWPVIIPSRSEELRSPLWIRLLWMSGIWAASIAVLLVIAMVLRWVLKV